MTKLLLVKDQNDHGAIAARHGYKFQDYVATNLVLDMLIDNSLKGVRCEKIDDIDLIFIGYTEYIQVKSTSGEKYWNLGELHKKQGKKTIVQKSLDSDCELEVVAKFRIITERGIQNSLKHLEINRSNRLKSTQRSDLIKSIKGKIKDYKSPNNNDTEYWVDNCLWQVIPSMQDALLLAQKKINIFSNSFGIPVFDDEVDVIYYKILRLVSEIADQSNKQYTTEQKTFSRNEVRLMIKEWLDQICLKRTSHKKVYNKNREIVLSPLSKLQTDDSKRSSHGYFLEYARNKFRHEKIVKNILEWMPEFLLSPRELAETDSSDCYSVWRKTLERIKQRPVDIDISTLISEVLLHMLIRYDKRSQPISGMLYINSGKEIKEFNNVHIIRNLDIDELWMGSAFVSQEYSVDSVTKDFAEFLYSNLDPDIFDTSKNRVFEAKQDNHLLPHSVNELLTPKATISGYADRYKFASLFVYDSEMLGNGYTENYKQDLIDECEVIFKTFCLKIEELNDNEINRVSISVYLLPLENFDNLMKTFNEDISNA